jgi:hypothetical protein
MLGIRFLCKFTSRLKKLKMKTNIVIPFVESQSNWLNWSVFVGETFADPTIKKSKYFLSNLKYQLKNKYPPLAKNIAKGYHSVVTHVLYHFCDMSLMTACVIFCKLTSFTLSAHVLSWETPFASWPKSENDQDDSESLIDDLYILYWHITVDIAF